MDYTFYQLFWFFLIYAFLGWLCETALAAARKRRLLNRGFLSTPFSPVYGLSAVLFAIFLPELRDTPFFLFLGGMILATALELITGILLEKLTGQKWWDYSGRKFQFEGHICLTWSLVWGAAALLCLFVGNPLLVFLVGLIPRQVGQVILIVVYAVLLLDQITSIAALLQLKVALRSPEELSRFLRRLTQRLDNAITRYIQRRLARAYGLSRDKLKQSQDHAADRTVFAQGCGFYKLACLFFLGALLGDLIEMVFCRITMGYWMSRSSLVWGPFSIVWGLGAVLLTALLYKHRNKSDGYIFFIGTVAGGAYEYMCSVFTELVFGSVFWDYSHIPFNLGGRINLLFCFFWGIAAVVWLKWVYPLLSGWIEKLPIRTGKILTWAMVVFMVCDMAVSCLALGRYTQRQIDHIPPRNSLEQFLDDRFPDERMEQVYPKIKFVA